MSSSLRQRPVAVAAASASSSKKNNNNKTIASSSLLDPVDEEDHPQQQHHLHDNNTTTNNDMMEQSFTELPIIEKDTGKPSKDYTTIPSAQETKEQPKKEDYNNTNTNTNDLLAKTLAGASSSSLSVNSTPSNSSN